MSSKNNSNLGDSIPGLAAEWHASNDRSPYDVTIGSQYKALWRCKKCGHIWQTEVRARVGRGTRKGTNCPNCTKPDLDKCLAYTHPSLIAEWHPTKNILTPNDVTFGSNEEAWWICAKNSKHEWEMKISSRTSKQAQGCPYCAGKRVNDEDSLAAINPELASEFHPTKNGTLTPSNLLPGSQEKVWWICKINPEHEWQARIGNRHINKSRCPFCYGNVKDKLDHANSFGARFPHLIPEWHHTKNSNLTPHNVSYGSQDKAWFLCKNGHEYESTILSRSYGHGCPYCSGMKTSIENSIEATHKDILEYWDYDKNVMLPSEVSRGSRKLVWWKCDLGGTHSYQAKVCERIGNENRLGLSCTECHRPPVSDPEIRLYSELNYIFPNTIMQQSYELNEDILKELKPKIPDIVFPSYKLIIEVDGANWHTDEKDKVRNEHFSSRGYKVLCLRGKPLSKLSEYDVIFNCRKIIPADVKEILKSLAKMLDKIITNEYKQAIQKYLLTNTFVNEGEYKERKKYINNTKKRRNFLLCHPDLARQWHPTKNDRQPDRYSPCCADEVWWVCDNGHEYRSRISHRVYGQDCPKCKSLAFLYPNIAAELHPDENADVTAYDILAGSNKIYTWLCSNSHSWKASPDRRIRENAQCPYCQGRRVCKDNCLAAVNPKLAAEWHHAKNSSLFNKAGELLTPKNVTAGQKIKVYWQCANHAEHVWEATIDSRNRGNGCPFCSGRAVHITNCLATVNPQLASEWHQDENEDTTPYDVTPGSKYNACWICPNGHKYRSLVLSRSHGHGCPECAKKIKSETAHKRWAAYRLRMADLDIV